MNSVFAERVDPSTYILAGHVRAVFLGEQNDFVPAVQIVDIGIQRSLGVVVIIGRQNNQASVVDHAQDFVQRTRSQVTIRKRTDNGDRIVGPILNPDRRLTEVGL